MVDEKTVSEAPVLLGVRQVTNRVCCEDSCLLDVEEFDRGVAEIAGTDDLDMFEGWDGWVREVEAGKQRRSRGFGAALAAEKNGATAGDFATALG